MDLDCLKGARQIVTGTKQTSKAVEAGKAVRVFVAKDADERILRPVLEVCASNHVPVDYVETMEDLGKACNIKVKAAMAAILKD